MNLVSVKIFIRLAAQVNLVIIPRKGVLHLWLVQYAFFFLSKYNDLTEKWRCFTASPFFEGLSSDFLRGDISFHSGGMIALLIILYTILRF